MNKELIRLWNETVGPEDIVYHLGDFALGPKTTGFIVYPQLNGIKHLVIGNHDRSETHMKAMGWVSVQKELSLAVDGYRLYLRHHPGPVPDGYDYRLCGHVHDKWVREGNCINVGVDVRGYKPITLSELLK
jgi:calcineurin-like phosphoesterase family protein